MQKNNSFFVSINRGGDDGHSIERLLDQKITEAGEMHLPRHAASGGDEKVTINISETDDTLIIRALVPGVPVENIEVLVEDEVVTIRARTNEEDVSEGTALYEEHRWGTLSRSIMLPKRIKREGNAAELKNGVLTIRLKKSLPRPPKKLAITDYE